MSFDRATRNLLANTVGKIRDRLKADVMDELRRLGFQDDGTVLDLGAIGGLSEAERTAAAALRALLAHLIAAERGADGAGARGRGERAVAQAAYDRMAREIGFTTLNRLVALRMAEERGLIVQSVGAGLASSGFQIYEQLVGGALGSRHATYRAYLECLYDEIARDLPALFDRTDPHSLIFPGERCLEDVLALLNGADLAHLWAEDETIGWVYQYYNDPEERKKMRESQAPRTSRELAVRNQFFTPRYVVEFLTDNTLGRTWYEMRRGETRLVEQCRYMVRRKRPVFLGPGEDAPRPFNPAADLRPGLTAGPGLTLKAPKGYPGRVTAPEGATDSGVDGREQVMGDPDGRTEVGEDGAGEWGLWTRPSADLTEVGDIERYALTFNGYRHAEDHLGATEATAVSVCGAIAERLETEYRERGKWQGSFEELRIALFVAGLRLREGLRLRSHGSVTPTAVGSMGDGARDERDVEAAGGPGIRALYQAVCRQWDLETEYIPYRAPKDPRDLKILDPACGSAHFLLYAFDALATIYEEAWAWDRAAPSEATGHALRDDYPDPAALRHAVPALILAHNLHGIDIDPRACQIAALALWLRAQRAYQALGLRAAERPAIARGNIVCAAPMPGDRVYFRRFLADLESPTLARLAEAMWDELALAGVAGSLLKPEQRLREIVAEEHARYRAQSRGVQQTMFTEHLPPVQQTFDFSDVTDDRFWDAAEERILAVLREYGEATEDGEATARRLFAADGAQGFRFVDLLRQRHDVVLMNPPFGLGVGSAKQLVAHLYRAAKNDLYSSFVARALNLIVGRGRVGAITSRSGFFQSGFKDWRTYVLSTTSLEVVSDLGSGVLDNATVETAAYVICKESDAQASGEALKLFRDHSSMFVRLMEDNDKGEGLESVLRRVEMGETDSHSYGASQRNFSVVPGSSLSYWISPAVRALFTRFAPLEGSAAEVRLGPHTSDDFRFLRCTWEVLKTADLTTRGWTLHAKGGEYSLYYSDVHLLLNWHEDGREVKCLAAALYGQWSRTIMNQVFYFRPGLTYPRRTQRGFNLRALPAGCIFADKGPAVFALSPSTNAYLLGLLNSSVVRFLLSTQMAFGAYEVGAVQRLPYAMPPSSVMERTGVLATICHDLRRDETRTDETTHVSTACSLLCTSGSLLSAPMQGGLQMTGNRASAIVRHSYEIDIALLDLYKIGPDDRAAIDKELKPHPGSYPDDTSCLDEARFRQAYLTKETVADEDDDAVADDGADAKPRRTLARYRDIEDLAHLFRVHPSAIARRRAELGLIRPDELAEEVENLLSYCIGVVFGRWDARIGKHPDWATTLGGAFEPLPICSPGMLTEDAALLGVDGPLPYRPERLPAKPEQVPAEYPIAIQWSGILADDAEHPSDDIVRRLRAVLAYLFEERAEAIEAEACEILKVKRLREYVRRPASFFAHHLAQYSKSRRQAPIYWPLSTASGSYTLWIYYHRLTSDTLFTAVNRYVLPKIAAVERDLTELGARLDTASGREATRLREELERVQAFRDELRAFRDELLRVAALPYRPDLNDGAIINAAPLHKLFRLPKWAKDTRECWSKLERGDYDWAHLAYTIWPERVRAKCRADKSLAIAHGLEELYVEAPGATGKKRRGRAGPAMAPAAEADDDE